MKRLMLAALCSLVLTAVAGCGDGEKCGRYTGTMGGIKSSASCIFKVLPDHTLMSCKITSGAISHTFSTELIEDRGYADMVQSLTGTRTRVRVELTADGFLLTLDPSGQPVQYRFTCF